MRDSTTKDRKARRLAARTQVTYELVSTPLDDLRFVVTGGEALPVRDEDLAGLDHRAEARLLTLDQAAKRTGRNREDLARDWRWWANTCSEIDNQRSRVRACLRQTAKGRR